MKANSQMNLIVLIFSGLCLIGCGTQSYSQPQAAYGQQAYGQNQYNNGSGQIIGKPNQARNAALGAVTGAAIGQLWGKDTEATVTGSIVGGVIGSQINTAY